MPLSSQDVCALDVCSLACQPDLTQIPVVAQPARFHCDVRASFACAFTAWREKRNIPLKKIAQDLSVSVSTVSAWELGRRFPTGSNLELLVEYTGLPPCKLFCVMADQCVPADCLLAMRRIPSPSA
jgi:hypothetical protein